MTHVRRAVAIASWIGLPVVGIAFGMWANLMDNVVILSVPEWFVDPCPEPPLFVSWPLAIGRMAAGAAVGATVALFASGLLQTPRSEFARSVGRRLAASLLVGWCALALFGRFVANVVFRSNRFPTEALVLAFLPLVALAAAYYWRVCLKRRS